MTAKQELNSWIDQYTNLKSDVEKQAFHQRLKKIVDERDEEQNLHGLLALKEWLKDVRKELENERQPAIQVLQVFPSSEEDRAILQTLLVRLNIPFRLSA